MSDVEVRVRNMLDEAGMTGSGAEELAQLLMNVEARFVDDTAPEPGPELAALVQVLEAAPLRRPHPHRRRAAAAGAVALGVVLSAGWAAAANQLPARAQRWVAELADRYLPFGPPCPEDLLPHGRLRLPEDDRLRKRLDPPEGGPSSSGGPPGDDDAAVQDRPGRDVGAGDSSVGDGGRAEETRVESDDVFEWRLDRESEAPDSERSDTEDTRRTDTDDSSGEPEEGPEPEESEPVDESGEEHDEEHFDGGEDRTADEEYDGSAGGTEDIGDE
jgi:hypothetical protein